MTTPPPRIHSAYAMLVFAALFWAGNAIVARALHDSIPPVSLAFWRWLAATLLLLPFGFRSLWRHRRALACAWPRILLLSLLGISAFNTLLYMAAHTTTATNIALIQTAMPAAIVILGALLLGERISPRQSAGVAMSMAGAVLIVMRGDPANLAQWQVAAGDLWMLAAVAAYALYSVLLRKRPHVPPLAFLTATFVMGTLLLAPLYLWELAREGAPQATAGVVAGVAYVAVFPSIFAYLFWNRGVDAVGAGRAGFFICLIPVFTAALASVFLGEVLRPYHLFGLLLIMGGFVVFNYSRAPA